MFLIQPTKMLMMNGNLSGTKLERSKTRLCAADRSMPPAGEDYRLPENVSQLFTSPLAKPRWNHSMRWAEVPWLKLSGTT